jgi:hypothetical protein
MRLALQAWDGALSVAINPAAVADVRFFVDGLAGAVESSHSNLPGSLTVDRRLQDPQNASYCRAPGCVSTRCGVQ